MEAVWHWEDARWEAGPGGLGAGDSLWRQGLALVETVLAGPGGAPFWPLHRRRLEEGWRRLGWGGAPPAEPPRPDAPAALRLVASWDVERKRPVLRAHSRPLRPPDPWPAAGPPVPACPPPGNLAGLKLLTHTLAITREDAGSWYDRLLVNPRGEAMEGRRHNVFWADREGRIFTPALATGCVAGVGRQWSLEQLADWGQGVREVRLPYPDWSTLAECWFTNALYGPIPLGHIAHTACDRGLARWGPALAAAWTRAAMAATGSARQSP